MTARALDSIGRVGGPRCCKRDSWLAILAAVDFVRERLRVEMERTVPVCPYSRHNSQCIGSRCPFWAVNRKKPTVAFLCVHNSCRSQMACAAAAISIPSTFWALSKTMAAVLAEVVPMET